MLYVPGVRKNECRLLFDLALSGSLSCLAWRSQTIAALDGGRNTIERQRVTGDRKGWSKPTFLKALLGALLPQPNNFTRRQRKPRYDQPLEIYSPPTRHGVGTLLPTGAGEAGESASAI
jgi:hypothetical protein